MGSNNPRRQRQRTLGHFLVHLLDVEKVQGLEWINRDDKLLKILWMDKRSTKWANVENIIYKKWEIYNNRYNEGNEEKWTDWKQTFRGALNRSPYVEAVPEMYELKNTSMPFRVYKLTTAVGSIRKPGSALEQKKSIKSSSNSQEAQSISMPLKENNRITIPQVVIDVLSRDSFMNSTNHPANEINIYGGSNGTASPLRMQQQQSEAVDMEITNGLNLSPMSDHVSNDSVTMHGFGNHGYSDYNSDVLNVLLQQSPQQNLEPVPCPYGIENPGMMMMETKDKPIAKFRAYYLNNPVLDGAMDSSGIRLFFGSKSLINCPEMSQHPDLCNKLRGPSNYKQIELPDVDKCGHFINENDIRDIQDILRNLARGLLLFSCDRKLFAYRLCTTRVFAAYGKEGSIVIDRRNKLEQQLFDMNIFETQLNLFKNDPRNNQCPSPTVILSFGQEFDYGQQPLVHLELTFLEAENMLKREYPVERGRDIQISGFDSCDYFIEDFKQSLTLNSTESGSF